MTAATAESAAAGAHADQRAAEVRVAPVSAFDVPAHAALQQRVFGEVLEENGIPLERLGPEVFAWKLRPPAGEGRVAVIEEGGVVVSSCSAFPVALDDGRRGWHLCDAVTAPEVRGRGYFGQVLTTLRESLPADEWAFAFPNGLSRGAFERQGFTAAVKVPLWFRPVIGAVRGSDAVAEVEAFGAEHDELARRVAVDGKLTGLRSAAYLRWRYREHPYFGYTCLELRRDGQLDGLLVLNRMEARGRTSLWVMELLAVDPAARRELARTARAFAKQSGCDVVLSMAKGKLPGALRLPPCFLPKEHLLMVRSGGTTAPREVGEWDVQTGDWDTF